MEYIFDVFFEFVESNGIFDHLNDAAIRPHGDDFIRSEEERKALEFEDIVELGNEL